MRVQKMGVICFWLLFTHAALFSFEAEPVLRGFSAESTKEQRELEQRITKLLDPARAEKLLQTISSRPHLTGTEGTRITAEYIRDQLKEYGLPAQIDTYTAYLTEPVSTEVELLAPVRETIPTTEDVIESDPFTQNAKEHPGWAGYSPSGEATAEVVYAHHGSQSDLDRIRAMGIEVKGKIALMRYFGTGEGTKVRNAQRAGAIGVVLYSDPAEDGYRYGETYPKGNWRPWGGIMRRSVIPLWYDGDPLSPGWASLPGAKRLKPEEVDLPKIPVLPISYRSAQRILNLMEGPLAPHDMQGELPIPYKLGPGPAKVRIKTVMNNGDRPMLNVMSRIEGAMYPDQWIIVGNHHDAWIYGAGDPSSGTASLLEFARVLGEMLKHGHRPKRTLILAFWDAEEMLLGGSTEWVEHHREELLQKAVACINMDSSVFNTDRPLSVNAHPVLHELFRDVSRVIRDPKTGKTMFEAWLDLQNQFRKTPSVDGWGDFFNPDAELKEPWIFESPSDDAAPFFQQLALPASDMYYGADYGMYHSIYENFHWMKTVVDPTFEYHIAMSQLQGFVSLRLANADILPLDYNGEAKYWRMAYEELADEAKAEGKQLPLLQNALKLIDAWQAEAQKLQRSQNMLLQKFSRVSVKRRAQLNRMLYLVARDFYRKDGLPGRGMERNMWSGGNGILPGLRFALQKGDAAKEANIYIAALQRRVNTLRALHKALGS